ncbi:MAG: c-type cytochrome [Planctomycetaceae bacterium]
MNGSGEHGPHAVLPHPDGKSLVIISGNRTDLTEISTSRVPQTWDEDRLIPRPTGRFMRGTRAPGGYICRIDPDGKEWELMASGFRNEFDGGYNADGELFTYDADMEWDLNTPWYRPTRICHVVSGAEFGWRSGGGKWPVYYADSVPPVINIGPGSPTGTTFGYGAKFPAKYQKAFFASDWSFGKLYAVHMKPEGSTYTAETEEFVTGTPLPLTDVIVNPTDGAMYFLIGGRRVQSGLYRVTYTGSESTAKADCKDKKNADLRKLRHELEALHIGDHPGAVEKAWPHLGHEDRFIRYAARIAIEHRPVAEWQQKLAAETSPRTIVTALMAMARSQQRTDKGKNPDIDSAIPDWTNLPEVAEDRRQLRDFILAKFGTLMSLNPKPAEEDVLDTLRVLTLTFLRVAPPTKDFRDSLGYGLLSKNFQFQFPTKSYKLNSELAYMLVYLQVPEATERIVNLLLEAPTQEEQIDLAASLRHMKAGWTPELREKYFGWFVRALSYRGGASFNTFVTRIREEAVSTLTDDEKKSLEKILNKKPDTEIAFSSKPRKMVKKWTMEELAPMLESKLTNRDFNHGRRMFAEAKCFACHRFDNQGGTVGPDLTSLAGRFSKRDILESVLDPNKQISDQYEAIQILTVDGKVITGRIANLAGDSIRLQTDMLDPGSLVGVDRKLIEEMQPSKASMMPEGLLNTMNEDEVLDLMAYLLSRGDSGNPMFKQD